MSHENMISCARIMKVELKSDMDPRDFTQLFIHHFAERYQGPKNFVGFLKSLVMYLETYPCLKELAPKLEWLKTKTNLKREALFLFEEDEMNRFPEYLSTELSEDFSQLAQYPDIKSKLLHLMDLVLHNPKYYQKLRTFCETRPALRKYVLDDVQVMDEEMIYVSIFLSSVPICLFLVAYNITNVYIVAY